MRSFADVLREVSGGRAYENANARLAEVVAGVLDSRKAGEITLKLKVTPNGDNTVKVTVQTTAKVPEPNIGDSIFFASEDGDLTRDDPRQEKLPLREVPRISGELKEAKA